MDREDNSDWYAFGVSHKKADFQLRTRYALSQEEINHYYQDIFRQSATRGFVLATCNRTSFFLYGSEPKKIEAHFAALKATNMTEYDAVSYRYEGKEAVQHFFEVAAGLDSQIPGDFEIIGQMKKAAVQAKFFGVLSGEIEKLTNAATFASRRIKNETRFSSGTCSVSYAAVRLLKDQITNFSEGKILILGLGMIGRQVLENLLKHKSAENIWICNRSEEKALELAAEYGVNVVPFIGWKTSLARFDAMVNAALSPNLLLDDEEIEATAAPSLFLDLAIPAALGNTQGNKIVYNIDEISAYIDSSISKRLQEIPKAQHIVDEELKEFYTWQTARIASPFVHAIGEVLEQRLMAKQIQSAISIHQRKRVQARLFQSIRQDPQKLKRLQNWIIKPRTQ